MLHKKIAVLVVPLLFFLISLFTLGDYGISWDEPIHFHRGQSYVHLLTTGEKTFPKEPSKPRVSYYEKNSLNAQWFLEHGGGHPPLSDILSAVFNRIFYQKLNIVSDIHAYHLYNIAASTLLVLIVAVFAYQTVGVFGSIVASVSLSTYPLFWAESKFNIKDPVQTAFFAGTIYAFWMSLENKSWKWLLLSVLSCAFALGTKFNIFFLPFILVPYLVFRYWGSFKTKKFLKEIKSFGTKYWVMLFLSPIVVFSIFFTTWPYLWADPINNFLSVTGYYTEIGTGPTDQPAYLLPFDLNGFPLYWIVNTTYPYLLILGVLGIVWSIVIYKKERNAVGLLWLFWLIVPIARVTAPNTSIYGGIRQIMEFLPALSLLAGAGAVYLVTQFNKHKGFLAFVLLVPFIHLLLVLSFLHPNENVYFNSFVGGLKGAQEKNVPYYGNSFGNAYWPLLQWLNENAEPNARLALVQGTALNIPDLMLREDITRWNIFWSGIDRKGEYLIELTHQDPVNIYPYSWDYVNNFLEPVKTVDVEGVAIAKLWKNDIDHTREYYARPEEIVTTDVKVEGERINVSLATQRELTRVVISFSEKETCDPVTGRFYVSLDGDTWTKEVEGVPYQQMAEIKPIDDGVLSYFFPGRKAKYVQFESDSIDSCILNSPHVEVRALSNRDEKR